jgi:hypothetical protein
VRVLGDTIAIAMTTFGLDGNKLAKESTVGIRSVDREIVILGRTYTSTSMMVHRGVDNQNGHWVLVVLDGTEFIVFDDNRVYQNLYLNVRDFS